MDFSLREIQRAFAEEINILIEDKQLRKIMSRNARKTAENYSWDKIAKKTLEVYQDSI